MTSLLKTDAVSLNTTEARLIAKAFYESYNGHDIRGSFDSFIAPDLINHTMSGVFDRAHWLHFDAAFINACPDLFLTVMEQFVQADRVVTHWMCRGTHWNTFLGMAATGNVIELTGISIDEVRDGRIVEHFAMADFTKFMERFQKKDIA